MLFARALVRGQLALQLVLKLGEVATLRSKLARLTVNYLTQLDFQLLLLALVGRLELLQCGDARGCASEAVCAPEANETPLARARHHTDLQLGFEEHILTGSILVRFTQVLELARPLVEPLLETRDLRRDLFAGFVGRSVRHGRSGAKDRGLSFEVRLAWWMLESPILSVLMIERLRIFLARDAYISEMSVCARAGRAAVKTCRVSNGDGASVGPANRIWSSHKES